MKKTEQRLKIKTPWSEVNSELEVAFSFADSIVSDWSTFQAEAFYKYLLTNEKQKDISKSLKISNVALHLRLKSGKFESIELFKKRFENLILSKI